MSAVLSPDGLYRYRLDRHLGQCDDLVLPNGRLCWIMLNPSTADAELDDPTIRRVRRFTVDNGYSDLAVVNLFAFRATDPSDLQLVDDPVGPANDAFVAAAVLASEAVVAAWGAANPFGCRQAMRWRIEDVEYIVGSLGRPMVCLGTTKVGHPRHPLYVKADQPLEPWV